MDSHAQSLTPGIATPFSRENSIWASRVIACSIVAMEFGLYFVQPGGWFGWTAETLFRAYLHFLAGVMAHEAVHGHMGTSKRTNLWWGRFAIFPSNVPYVNFRLTHIAHHRFTNIPGKDPDEFLNTDRRWEVPFRAWLMPHQWVFWLHQRRMLSWSIWREWALTYLTYFVVFTLVASQVGWGRVFWGIFGAGTLHALLLWYSFAIKTHEGYSKGDAPSRSHDYHGKVAFWSTLGLSLHRVHHIRPDLGWLQTTSFVAPCTWWQALTFRRDVRSSAV